MRSAEEAREWALQNEALKSFHFQQMGDHYWLNIAPHSMEFACVSKNGQLTMYNSTLPEALALIEWSKYITGIDS